MKEGPRTKNGDAIMTKVRNFLPFSTGEEEFEEILWFLANCSYWVSTESLYTTMVKPYSQYLELLMEHSDSSQSGMLTVYSGGGGG